MNLISKLKQLFSRPRTTVIIVDTIEDVMEQYGMNRNNNHIIIFTNLNSQKDICSICREQMIEEVISTECNHKFHKNCIKEWFEHSLQCPVCRTLSLPPPPSPKRNRKKFRIPPVVLNIGGGRVFII